MRRQHLTEEHKRNISKARATQPYVRKGRCAKCNKPKNRSAFYPNRVVNGKSVGEYLCCDCNKVWTFNPSGEIVVWPKLLKAKV